MTLKNVFKTGKRHNRMLCFLEEHKKNILKTSANLIMFSMSELGIH